MTRNKKNTRLRKIQEQKILENRVYKLLKQEILKEEIRKQLENILLEGAEEGHNYEYTSLTDQEKDNFAEKIGLSDILRMVQTLDDEAAKEVIENIKDRLKDFTTPIMKDRLKAGRATQARKRKP